jgi:hypothetical protein
MQAIDDWRREDADEYAGDECPSQRTPPGEQGYRMWAKALSR